MAAGCASSDSSGVQDVKTNENISITENAAPKKQITSAVEVAAPAVQAPVYKDDQ